jgi:enoyl-CoA hydratase/carnithine racemase
MQNWISLAEKLNKPIIGVLSGFCIGAAVNLISAFDIRFGT